MSEQREGLRPPAPPTRREILVKGVTGALALTGLGLAPAAVFAEDPTPGTTQGPYWIDEMLNRSDIRSDPTTGAVALGLPLRLTINVSQLDAQGNPTPLPGSYVDIWHCNSLGVYSDVAAQDTVGMKFLRGYQVTDARGNAKFTTIYPGWYPDRTPHIHVRVRVYDAATQTFSYDQVSQLFLADAVSNQVYQLAPYNSHPDRDTSNATDMIYNADTDSDGVIDGDELLLKLALKGTYAIATYNFYLDLAEGNGNGDDQNDGGGGPPGGDPPPGGPPDGGGPPGPPPGG